MRYCPKCGAELGETIELTFRGASITVLDGGKVWIVDAGTILCKTCVSQDRDGETSHHQSVHELVKLLRLTGRVVQAEDLINSGE
jgi:hypothetical protein